MTLALHSSGASFVALILLSLLVGWVLISLLGDDEDESTWLR